MPSSLLFKSRRVDRRWPHVVMLVGVSLAAIVGGVRWWKTLPPDVVD